MFDCLVNNLQIYNSLFFPTFFFLIKKKKQIYNFFFRFIVFNLTVFS